MGKSRLREENLMWPHEQRVLPKSDFAIETDYFL
jgi:hypothetical protein